MIRPFHRLVTAESMLLGSPLHAVQWLAWKSFALQHPATTSSHRHWHSDGQRRKLRPANTGYVLLVLIADEDSELAKGSARIIVDGLSYRVAWV
ncbi:hypothetical protein HBI70_227730 [Parastagonospora nodorum]|nr:hypothetical protein HBH45_102380 [Parastagonospora nodorum]KAH4174006.1 hypothetical protein HBH43_085990 [Parastagonospora nodorum]KAH4210343.1 hypothetical protein HBI95_074390 [Parastagonospora nodorum]KAH4305440.1 hypothetical protein HBI01_072510 [Parastagonospora nodorum]KAH4329441.1 hypothetical protein HBI00_103440 [Parastagonospora nodorum]